MSCLRVLLGLDVVVSLGVFMVVRLMIWLRFVLVRICRSFVLESCMLSILLGGNLVNRVLCRMMM